MHVTRHLPRLVRATMRVGSTWMEAYPTDETLCMSSIVSTALFHSSTSRYRLVQVRGAVDFVTNQFWKDRTFVSKSVER